MLGDKTTSPCVSPQTTLKIGRPPRGKNRFPAGLAVMVKRLERWLNSDASASPLSVAELHGRNSQKRRGASPSIIEEVSHGQMAMAAKPGSAQASCAIDEARWRRQRPEARDTSLPWRSLVFSKLGHIELVFAIAFPGPNGSVEDTNGRPQSHRFSHGRCACDWVATGQLGTIDFLLLERMCLILCCFYLVYFEYSPFRSTYCSPSSIELPCVRPLGYCLKGRTKKHLGLEKPNRF